jgi:mono/diheme cytochrome c family protein
MTRCFQRTTRVALGLALLAACACKRAAVTPDPLLKAYAVEQDSNDPQHLVPLNYQQAQGARVFQNDCVWCHADATPAGPSNRSNVTPAPPLVNDGATLNPLSDEFLQNVITLGGSAMGKSAMMPPWGRTLSGDEIRSVIAYMRVVAQPAYQPPALPRSPYPVR